MKIILKIVSILALLFTVGPASAYLMGKIDLDQMKWIILLSTIVWFICAPFWFGIKQESQET